MLNVMRKNAQNWLIKIILGAIVIVFVFWGVGSFTSKRANRVAQVNGEPISIEAYRTAYNNMVEQYRRRFGGQLTDEMLEMLHVKRLVVDQLVGQAVILQEAQRQGLQVTDEELSASIASIPAFQRNGTFNSRLYRNLLSRLRMSPEDFEVTQRQQLLVQKVSDLVVASAFVGPEEVRQRYDWENAGVNLDYLFVDPARYEDITADADELAAYYEKNKDNYKTAPQVKVRYVLFSPADFDSQVTVDADEIETYYRNHPDEFRMEKTVTARHILLKVAPDADPETVEKRRREAAEIAAKAKAGEDFAKLAKTYSEGPTKDSGGNLGTFERGSMVKPFADKAFSMKAGEISDPVKTQFGWHIIKVEKVNPEKVEDLAAATPKIEKKLREQKTKALALDAAESFYDDVFTPDDFTRIAGERGLSLVTSDFFEQGKGPAADIPNKRKFTQAAFDLPLDEVSEIIDLDTAYAMMQVTAKKAAEVQALDTVKDRVMADLLKEKRGEKAKSVAEGVLEAARAEGSDLAKATAAKGFKLKSTGVFKRNDSIPGIGYERDLAQAAFALTNQNPLADKVFKAAKGYYLIALKDRETADPSGFDEQKETIRQRLLQQKQNTIYKQWLADAKARSEIVIEAPFVE
ncbi:MAG: SurA N-terminal domain-containing protein [Desulfosarcinaceae bacterium]